jgi:Glyoxalase/Bleomycin resistance protein/Dioxygenase superfamily
MFSDYRLRWAAKATHLIVPIDFYKRAFGATELLRMAHPRHGIAHAEIKIGDSVIMLADENPNAGYRRPRSLGGSTVSIMLYVADVDATFERAVQAVEGRSGQSRISSTEIVRGRPRIRSATSGRSRLMWKMSRRKR